MSGDDHLVRATRAGAVGELTNAGTSFIRGAPVGTSFGHLSTTLGPWAWGLNVYGQLGSETANGAPPQQIDDPGVRFTALGGGDYHSLALAEDTSLWSWGRNDSGQLGDGLQSNRPFPAPVSGLSGVVGFDGGLFHTLAVNNTGEVWAWGANAWGQLGNASIPTGYGDPGAFSSSPVRVDGLTDVVAVSAGAEHSLALRYDGSVWGWGRNDTGQIGSEECSLCTTPVLIPGVLGVRAIAAGAYHSLALKNDGTVWAWGSNFYGELADGMSDTWRTAPAAIMGLTSVAEISAGQFFSLARLDDGTIQAWGSNSWSQLGATTSEKCEGNVIPCSRTPIRVTGLTEIARVQAGQLHAVALKSDGTLWAWGQHLHGQLGMAPGATGASLPVQILGLDGVIHYGVGGYHTLASTSS
jgi:alpha-tubulin suppressor-like RCC1 family protein